MSITNYTELKTAVANWLNRTDLTGIIPDFITLAESKLNSDIRARSMELRTTLSTTASNAYVTLPSDLLEMNRLIVQTDPIITLKYVSPDEISSDYPWAETGKPAVFAIIGSELQLAPKPDAVYTLELTYQQKIPALSATNTTNWLLTAWPNAYLYGALCAAAPYLMADDRLQTFQAMYQQSINGINGVDWYSGSTMRVKAR